MCIAQVRLFPNMNIVLSSKLGPRGQYRNGFENVLDILEAYEEISWFSIVSKRSEHSSKVVYSISICLR